MPSTVQKDRPHFVAYDEDPSTHRAEPFATGIDWHDLAEKADERHAESGHRVYVDDEWSGKRVHERKRAQYPGQIRTKVVGGGAQ